MGKSPFVVPNDVQMHPPLLLHDVSIPIHNLPLTEPGLANGNSSLSSIFSLSSTAPTSETPKLQDSTRS